MVEIVYKNPYRIIGVYANSAVKERVGNLTRMKAYMKVGKTVDFPLDLPIFLSSICRTEELVGQAESQITLPADQLKYAQFWFVKKSAFDEIAFNHLFNGGIDKALEIWTKKDDVSSVQNRIVCALIKNDWQSVIQNAEKLYTNFSVDFANLILGENHTIQTDTLADTFLEELSNEVNASSFVSHISNSEWKQKLGEKIVKPIIASIEKEINEAKAAKGSPEARYRAGKKLMEVAKKLLLQLQQHLQTSDMKYQMIADKLGIEILQCGIDYYNGTEDSDSAIKAKILQDYATIIVVGKMAKDRCNENVKILNNIISQLPPAEVVQEDAAIKKALKSYKNQPEKISYAKSLLNNCKPHLLRIKQKLGASNTYYLKISTEIVSAAMHNVIEEVNDYQSNPLFRIKIESGLGLDKSDINGFKAILREAWSANLLMDEFDIESEFKEKYDSNRNTLKRMCNQLEVSTKKTPDSKREKIAIFFIHLVWGLCGLLESGGDLEECLIGFFVGAFAGLAGWIIPINLLVYRFILWIWNKIEEEE